MEAYFAEMVAKGGWPVEVRTIDETRGKGCFATAPIEHRSIVFQDQPLACLQSRKQTCGQGYEEPGAPAPDHSPAQDYPRPVATCEQCHKFVGSLWLQLALLTFPKELRLGLTDEHRLRACLPASLNFTLPAIAAEEADLSHSVFGHKTSAGLMLYCSEDCRNRAMSQSLIVRKGGTLNDIFQRFMRHADSTGNRFFILAAYFIQAIVCRLECGEDINDAARPYLYMASQPYGDTIDMPDDPFEAGLLHEEIKQQTEQSLQMLKELFADELRLYPALEPLFFSSSGYSSLLGGLNRNAMTIKVPSPLDHRVEAIHYLEPLLSKLQNDRKINDTDEGELEQVENANDEGSDDEDEHSEDDDSDEEDSNDDDNVEDELIFEWAPGDVDGGKVFQFSSNLFPPYKGYAFFPLLSTLNHSCEPNCQVAYLEDGRAVLFALRDIASGEELTISYIYTYLPIADRRSELRAYGFLCGCVRCKREQHDETSRHDDVHRSPKRRRTRSTTTEQPQGTENDRHIDPTRQRKGGK